MIQKIIILVLDGLGIGYMEDVAETRPIDMGVNTLLHVSKAAGELHLPVMESMGLGNVAVAYGIKPVNSKAFACYGRNKLAHVGADTYMGHQEIMGAAVKPTMQQLMSEVGGAVREHLEKLGHSVVPLIEGEPILLVDGCCIVADNVEGEVAMNINITASLRDCSYEKAVEIGMAVRSSVAVSRIIVCCSSGFDTSDIKNHIIRSSSGQYGVDTPGVGMYDESYRVRHIGCGVDVSVQATTMVSRIGKKVHLIGKTADIIDCDGAQYYPIVSTTGVFDQINRSLKEIDKGMIFANVQETDLAGHSEDPVRLRDLLHLADRRIGELLNSLTEEEVFILCGDHGNDPTVGRSHHTREMTPLLVYHKGIAPVSLGDRDTLGDIGTTACQLLQAGVPAFGHSFARCI